MTRRTKKVGVSGKYGSRYGVKIRRRINALESRQKKHHVCPECQYPAVKRVSSGIWICKHCGYTYTGGAYFPSTAAGESRLESLLIAQEQSTSAKTKNKEVSEKK